MMIAYGVADVARELRVTPNAVTNWLARYQPQDADNADGYPLPAVVLKAGAKEMYGWTVDQLPQWRRWYRTMQQRNTSGRTALRRAADAARRNAA